MWGSLALTPITEYIQNGDTNTTVQFVNMYTFPNCLTKILVHGEALLHNIYQVAYTTMYIKPPIVGMVDYLGVWDAW